MDNDRRPAADRLGIDEVRPEILGGRFPTKAVVGEVVPVTAIVWREGHDAVSATLAVRTPGPRGRATTLRIPMTSDVDTVHAVFSPTTVGDWTYRVEAWSDPLATWRHAVRAKVEAGQSDADLANDLELGARLFDRAAENVPRSARSGVLAAAAALRSPRPLTERIAPAFDADLERTLRTHPLRDLVTRGPERVVRVERRRALYGSWYEFFPRSTGGWNDDGTPRHGTFATAADDLPRIAAMGFDVVYLPPIHPIGEVNRKGPNNTLTAAAGDVGSPWAIGSREGGHDAVHPALGTLDDFRAFVDRAGELGLEVALDLALQCAPDHPWAREHRAWFTELPDGTIAYAENPPKKYQDIYPINFDDDPEGVYAEVARVVRHWIDAGVRIFRVDNPHTKPAGFWERLIADIHGDAPDVVFLAEAFTRPARLYGLARRGFSQSYTYFTWKTAKWELEEFGREIAARADEARPNLFVNTPDILHESLQTGGPAMFALRAALAATLSPTWGVYSGYELYEHVPLRPGSEEYLDSEKYQLRPRRYDDARARGASLEPWITTLNRIRRAHPALHQLRTLTFHHVDHDALIAYSKFDPTTGDCVLVVVNLDPVHPADGTLRLDMPAIGRQWYDRFPVTDEVSGEQWDWGEANYIRLEPWKNVAHVVVLPRVDVADRARLVRREI